MIRLLIAANDASGNKMDIVLSGLSILRHHATVENKDGRVLISPCNSSKTFVNGVLIDKATQLQQVHDITTSHHYYPTTLIMIDSMMIW
jgi:hypothetical protein